MKTTLVLIAVLQILPSANAFAGRCERVELSSSQKKMMKKLGAGALRCKFVQKCGELILVDCDTPADGPAYYINEKTEKVVSTCGGPCMRGCKNCPPKEWSCECGM